MSIAGLHGDNPGFVSCEETAVEFKKQQDRLFAAWKSAGFPKDQRPVIQNGTVQMVAKRTARALGF